MLEVDYALRMYTLVCSSVAEKYLAAIMSENVLLEGERRGGRLLIILAIQ